MLCKAWKLQLYIYIYIWLTHSLLPLSSSMDELTIINSKTVVLISVMCDSMWYKISLQGDGEIFCRVSKSSYSRGQLLVGTVLWEVAQSPWFFKIRNMTASLIAFLKILFHLLSKSHPTQSQYMSYLSIKHQLPHCHKLNSLESRLWV